MRRVIFPVLMGVVGCAVLVSLGIWQMQRLEWKETVLAQIAARIDGTPGAIPATLDPIADKYRPVRVTGQVGDGEIHVLTGVKGEGAAYRLIIPVDLGDRRIMADLGNISEATKNTTRPKGEITVTGNLHWPAESDNWTPDPDLSRNIWFARDVPAMAAMLHTDPVLIVARDVAGVNLGVLPRPVTTAGIPNDHLGYAITWFGLALVWAVMSVFLIRRVIMDERNTA